MVDLQNKDVSPHQYFWTRDGEGIASLEELASSLERMPQELFDFHTKQHGNDFAKWIESIYGNIELKRDIAKCANPVDAAKAIKTALKKFESKEGLQPLQNEAVGSAAAQTESGPGSSSVTQIDDEHFDVVKKDVNQKNESLGEKYDEITRRLQQVTADPMPADLDKLCERLLTRYNEIMLKISEQRRAGKDMLFASLQARQFMAKLSLAKATRQNFDFAIAEQILDQTQNAIAEAMSENELDVRSQVMALAQEQDKNNDGSMTLQGKTK